MRKILIFMFALHVVGCSGDDAAPSVSPGDTSVVVVEDADAGSDAEGRGDSGDLDTGAEGEDVGGGDVSLGEEDVGAEGEDVAHTDGGEDDASDVGEVDGGEDDLSFDEAQTLAADAYVFGYPGVLMRQTRASFLEAGGVLNRLFHLQEIPDHTFRAVVRPNRDTLYSMAWLDLRDGPLVFEVPRVPASERFYMYAFLDAWTNAFEAPGTRTNEGDESVYFISGPGYEGEVPEGMIALESPTDMVWVIGRVEVLGEEDIANVVSIQERVMLRTLEDYNARVVPEPVDVEYSQLSAEPGPSELVDQMNGEAFYTHLVEHMRENPPVPVDPDQEEKLERLGLVGEEGWSYEEMTPNRRAALDEAAASGPESLDELLDLFGDVSSWGPSHRVPLGDYGTNYIIRAGVARIGFGANRNEDARYMNASSDWARDALDGSQSYVIRMERDELPENNAFWSLTLYDENGFLTENDAGIHVLGSNSNLRMNLDGSVDIYIQPEPPLVPSFNWLPTPDGPFELTLRVYWPADSVLDGSWRAPRIMKRVF